MRYDSRVRPTRAVSPLIALLAQSWTTGIVLLALSLLPTICFARELSVTECSEAGDFIKNAALARDGGMSETTFLNKIRDDIDVIQSFPPHLRWFVQDDEDAKFLLTAATEVFQHPNSARKHQSDFFRTCLGKTSVAAKDLYRL